MRKQLIVAAALALAAAGTFAQQAPGSVPHPTALAPHSASDIRIPTGAAPHNAGEVHIIGLDGHTPRTVTRDEFIKDAAMHFDAMDANHDGVLTPEERRAFFEAHRAELERMSRPPLPASGAHVAGPASGVTAVSHGPAGAPVATH
ncbi:hypothetical protein KTD31_02450 [Burkholderia multivorans]|uniref:hypothetical protein n=1 Tax=Burkholderia multivorans TaxID=87883 RepID=UPI001C2477F2|nr:hypothetical protein [Burkholderia multivorans]MBU9200266.1 hypothetical protein [Burkholderia multivorans]MDN8078607.1 hypothetical protein [Burkholderia multivorans]